MDDAETRPAPWSRVLLQAGILIVASSATGLLCNALRPDGLPLSASALAEQTEMRRAALSSYADMPVLTTTQARALSATADVIWLDARDAEHYQQGHIPGAWQVGVHIKAEQESQLTAKVPKSARVVTYCGGPTCDRSLALARRLQEIGYADVHAFVGGMEAWSAAGMPVETGDQPGPVFVSEKHPPVDQIHLDTAKALHESGAAVFVDARGHDLYLAGHIPGAISLPLAEFDARFGEAFPRLAEAPQVVVYCDGQECSSSSELAGLLKESGVANALAFVGGWQEWQAAGLPIVEGDQP